jgi:hypothetical protein
VVPGVLVLVVLIVLFSIEVEVAAVLYSALYMPLFVIEKNKRDFLSLASLLFLFLLGLGSVSASDFDFGFPFSFFLVTRHLNPNTRHL